MSQFMNMVKGKCPKCGEGEIFKHGEGIFKLPSMHTHCDHCGHKFEKESGFFWGAMFVSYALAVIEITLAFITAQLFFADTYDDRIIWVISLVLLLLSKFNFKYARIVWIYIFTSKNYDI